MAAHPRSENSIMLARRANRWFDNEKLLMYNYLQNVLKMDIDDLVILARTIFVLLTSQDYDRLPHKPELKTVLDLILEKCTFLLPANDELDEMLRAIFDPGMIEQIQTRLDAGCVRVRIWINPQRKPEFFQKFKRFFDDITFFFKHVYGPDFKFQFS